MPKYSIIIILFILIIEFQFNAKSQSTDNIFTILSYNVENLFDTINAPDKLDDEYTPYGNKKWNTIRYQNKLDSIAKVIKSINKNELPEIIGLCEVENSMVVTDLLSKLESDFNYDFVHNESPDARGIDVALAFRTDEFSLLSKQFFEVKYSFDPESKTRDILYVSGVASGMDTLHIFVNHWSSRRSGREYSERKRVHTAKLLRAKADSIQKTDKNAKIIIIGDFNDEPTNYSLTYFLQANNKRVNAKDFELYNLMYDLKNIESKGTYSYRGNWDLFDQIIVTQSLLHKNSGYYTHYEAGTIFNPDWLIYYNTKADITAPRNTFGGNNYYGGFSDHLPVYFQLTKDN